MSTAETFLIAMLIIFTVPYLIWRLAKTEYYAPLVVVQIIAGILLGPGILGAAFPDYYAFVFNPAVVQSLNGVAWWAVMLFVWIAGIELDLGKAWQFRLETGVTAGLALGTPLVFGCLAAAGLLMYDGWIGTQAMTWQFIVGVGMACAVTALPILILFMEKLEILRQPIGQRILRYASLDDIAIWGVLALILMDWERIGRQSLFLISFVIVGFAFRKLMIRVPEKDRWYIGLIWLAACGFSADWAGLHFMVGAFLSGMIIDSHWFNQQQMDTLRHHVLLTIMPVFFLSTGLRTNWSVGGEAVFIAAGVLLIAAVAGKLAGTHLAGKFLNWEKGEASLIGWLLQTKALIMIIFANILLDKHIITSETFTALLLMAIASTMLTVPLASPILQRMKAVVFKSK
jgi:Kef-type K+ transport system membrane component KefB